MNQADFEQFQREAGASGLLFYYSGSFDSAMVQLISERLREKLQEQIASAPLKRKLFSIFVEMAQNVLHYGQSGQDANQEKPGAIAMGHDGDLHWIACGNLVAQEQVERLSAKLQSLRSMSAAEIKAAYREQLANDAHSQTDTASKGAGLGLLTIARESGHPIEFSFEPDAGPSGAHTYFHIKTTI